MPKYVRDMVERAIDSIEAMQTIDRADWEHDIWLANLKPDEISHIKYKVVDFIHDKDDPFGGRISQHDLRVLSQAFSDLSVRCALSKSSPPSLTEGNRATEPVTILTPGLMNATTVSCTGLEITIACNDHDTKDAIMNALVDNAYMPALATPQPAAAQGEAEDGTFAGVTIKRMSLLIETVNKLNPWEMEAVAEMTKAIHLLSEPRGEAPVVVAQGAPEAKQCLDLAATFENAKRVSDYNPAIRELQSDFTFFDDECKLIAKALRRMAASEVPEGDLAPRPSAGTNDPAASFNSLEDVILFVLRDMRASGSWDVKTMDRVVENIEQVFRSPSLPPHLPATLQTETDPSSRPSTMSRSPSSDQGDAA